MTFLLVKLNGKLPNGLVNWLSKVKFNIPVDCVLL